MTPPPPTNPAPSQQQLQPLNHPTSSTSTTTTTTTAAAAADPSSSSETKQTSEAKSAFTASLHSLGANYTNELVERAKVLHSNSAALSAQEDQLAKTTEALRKQNESWEGIAEDARKGLKEIGDVQNWAEVIERELLVVEETLRIAEAEEREREREGAGYSSSEEESGVGRRRGDIDEGVNGTLNGNGKVGDEEGQKGKGTKGKEPAATGTEKKGWFAWW
ncbi:hypothetical protein BJY01DRAFT_244769 [Aspergillus pseudoustus]|uniref:Biogenesis of lysosome-related organelles complex 1 subunit 1 n=1 Tax=Aspergillus pseudoustus TaxID=1810923 RepID=A0ABR4KI85_9EURO